ncbi:hypothetical protein [uncultured Desulfobacter sp.]|uniref:hypothetical protein n=1 Tax=uncultured Desulfobacter sp. TaxID=240139 RepID=UPI002AAAD7DC|nr:hypothetical protein [uncultured Desulfobacter sp.]
MSKIEKAKRDLARILGLSLAMVVRIIMLFILLQLATLTTPFSDHHNLTLRCWPFERILFQPPIP